MGEQLVEVVGIAQKTNMNVLSGRRSSLPVIGPWIDKLKMRGMRLQNQFETSKEQIDKVITEVQTTVAGLSKRNETLEVMFDNVRKEYYELSVHIVAGRVALARVNQLIEQRQQTATNPAELQELSDMQALPAIWTCVSATSKRFSNRPCRCSPDSCDPVHELRPGGQVQHHHYADDPNLEAAVCAGHGPERIEKRRRADCGHR
jgi:hypothetical protein